MATVEAPELESTRATSVPELRQRNGDARRSSWRDLFFPLASLRLTVVLLTLSIFLVLAGTLAQRFYDVWYPVGRMFRSVVAWVELRYFLPVSWWEPSPRVGFPFPGGWALGGLLGINLLTAHALRFKVTARGSRLFAGLVVLAVGVGATVGVIRSGLSDTLLSELTPQFANGLWHALRAALGGVALALAWLVAVTWPQLQKSHARWVWGFGGVVAGLLLALTLALFFKPQWRLDPSGLRILWQLIKGLGAAAILLAGCHLVFAKRAGIVLLHAGVALLMASELHTGLTAVESQMQIKQGQTATYSEDMRSAELAFVDKSNSRMDRVVRVPLELLQHSLDSTGGSSKAAVLDDPQLPLLVRPVTVINNSTVRWLQPGEESAATAGWGELRIAESMPASVGTDTKQQFDIPAAYVEFLDRATKRSLGTYLLHPQIFPQSIAAENGKVYEAELRFKRIEKPYQVQLIQFKAERYVGSDTPKHYESLVRLTDDVHDVDKTVAIWMNNPLRYAGDTLYQASFDLTGTPTTVLQVMTNSGWLVPYLACVFVGVAMFAHFAGVMARFVRRREDEAARLAAGGMTDAAERLSIGWSRRSLRRDWRLAEVWIPAVIVVSLTAWLAGRARVRDEGPAAYHLSEFAALPVASSGRLMPLDTLARTTLDVLSGRDAYDDANTKSRQPASRWLVEIASRAPGWQDHRVFRIDNLDVLQAIGLPQRSGFRYSYGEIFEHKEAYQRQIDLATRALQRVGKREELELTQAKFLELGDKIARFTTIVEAFAPQNIDGESQEQVIASLNAERELISRLESTAPRAIPPEKPTGQWEMPRAASFQRFLALLASRVGAKAPETNAAEPAFRSMLDAYADGKVGAFNERLRVYRSLVAERAQDEEAYEAGLAAEGSRATRKFVERLRPSRLVLEADYNRLGLFDAAKAMYIVAFVFALAGWLGWRDGFQRTANWTLWLALAVHTVALVARIAISGRPPVTNLYSSAVFIGWGAVLFALAYEIVYRLGIGNLLAAAIGFPSLVIASRLADGDTFTVMQAVLDTQFWLATHVVCISLGYTATFVAGFLGLFWIILSFLSIGDRERLQREITRMIYGTLCFAIFFSFVGTVLGGLWADDSWGRFWGWDPKENGALMIVLWNAVVLHARWGKLVGARGLAALAVFGNVVTAWSWFGVNQLDIGLHSYGRTSGIAIALGVFALTQIAAMSAAMLAGRTGAAPTPAADSA